MKNNTIAYLVIVVCKDFVFDTVNRRTVTSTGGFGDRRVLPSDRRIPIRFEPV